MIPICVFSTSSREMGDGDIKAVVEKMVFAHRLVALFRFLNLGFFSQAFSIFCALELSLVDFLSCKIFLVFPLDYDFMILVFYSLFLVFDFLFRFSFVFFGFD